jgi:hypothetical protein
LALLLSLGQSGLDFFFPNSYSLQAPVSTVLVQFRQSFLARFLLLRGYSVSPRLGIICRDIDYGKLGFYLTLFVAGLVLAKLRFV